MMAYEMVIPDEMRKKYLERRERDAEELSTALQAGKLDAFLKVGHQLKGNAATFGYDSLAELGRRMERAASGKDWSSAQECVYSLKAWVQEQSSEGEDG